MRTPHQRATGIGGQPQGLLLTNDWVCSKPARGQFLAGELVRRKKLNLEQPTKDLVYEELDLFRKENSVMEGELCFEPKRGLLGRTLRLGRPLVTPP